MEPLRKNIFEDGKILLFDKPAYWTSFDLVNKVRFMIRSCLGIKKIKVGHAGTLDPLATGLMILCTGKATKRIEEFRDLDKEYLATVTIGKSTPSYDLETEVDAEYPTNHVTGDLLKQVLESFVGEQMQLPPLHSAKFIDGKRAYEFARKGINRELTPVRVFFREISLISFDMPEIRVKIVCSKGTYVRSFARDLGKALGSGAYLSALERTAIGPNRIGDAFTLEKFEEFLEEMKQI